MATITLWVEVERTSTTELRRLWSTRRRGSEEECLRPWKKLLKIFTVKRLLGEPCMVIHYLQQFRNAVGRQTEWEIRLAWYWTYTETRIFLYDLMAVQDRLICLHGNQQWTHWWQLPFWQLNSIYIDPVWDKLFHCWWGLESFEADNSEMDQEIPNSSPMNTDFWNFEVLILTTL